MKGEIWAVARRALERIPSDGLYLFAMRQGAKVLGSDLRIARANGKVVLNNRHSIPSVRRLPFYIRGLDYRARKLSSEYLLDQIRFNPGDVVVDCGANVGDLLLTVSMQQPSIHYIAFEPGEREFGCLKSNAAAFPQATCELHHKALAAESGTAEFYVNSEAADNSLLEIEGATRKVVVEKIRLDQALAHVPRIKLLKLEAEGYEPEVIAGATGILDRVEYVSADVGFERGTAMLSTLPEVTNCLLSRGFEIVANGRNRLVLLFRNKAFCQ